MSACGSGGCTSCGCGEESEQAQVQDQSTSDAIDSSAIEAALKNIPVNTLIDEAKLYWNNPKRTAEAEQWDLIFTVIIYALYAGPRSSNSDNKGCIYTTQ